jgi:hypothetical protein
MKERAQMLIAPVIDKDVGMEWKNACKSPPRSSEGKFESVKKSDYEKRFY